MLSVQNLEVVYQDVILVLRGVSFEIPKGKIVALLGSNGSGKTTTLRAITGLLDTQNGDITKVDKSWGYKQDSSGNLKIVLHHSSLPYEG